MKDRKGQVLVAFVLLIPVIIMILALIVDVGFLYVEKRNTDNVIRDVTNYGLDKLNLEKNILQDNITKLVNANLDEIQDLSIVINTNSVEINITRNKQSIFSNVYKKANYRITSNYIGNISNSVKDVRKES